MQTCIAEYRALWLRSWRTRFFSTFFFQCSLAGYWMANKAPFFSQLVVCLVWILSPESLLNFFFFKTQQMMALLSLISRNLSSWMSPLLLSFPLAILHLPFFSPFPLPPAFSLASTHPRGPLLVICLIVGGIALTSTAQQKQQRYLRGFLALSELLIHRVSSLFCSEMQKEMSLFNSTGTTRFLLW